MNILAATGAVVVSEPLNFSSAFVTNAPSELHWTTVVQEPASVVGSCNFEVLFTVQALFQDWFQQHIMEYVPSLWREQDANGTLKDLLVDVFAITLDELKQAVDDMLDIIDIDRVPGRYLKVLAAFLNWPLSDYDSMESQRQQLRHAVSLYKKKGTELSFKAMLRFFGFDVDVVPLFSAYDPDGPYGVYGIFEEEIPSGEETIRPWKNYSGGGKWFPSPHFGLRLKGTIGAGRFAQFVEGTDQGNQVRNGSFELSTDAFQYWFLPASYTGTRELDGTYSAEGSRAAKLTSGVLSSPALMQDIVTQFNAVHIFKIKTAGSPVSVYIYDTFSGELIAGPLLTPSTNPGDFKESSLTFVARGAKSRIEIWGPDPGQSGATQTSWIDDVDVRLDSSYAQVAYFLDEPAIKYIVSRVNWIRPAFTVFAWLRLQMEFWDFYQIEDEEAQVIVEANEREPGWWLGWCVPPDPVYTRNDKRLITWNISQEPRDTERVVDWVSYWDAYQSDPSTPHPYNRWGDIPPGGSVPDWAVWGSTSIAHKRDPLMWYVCHPEEQLQINFALNMTEMLPDEQLRRDGMQFYPTVPDPTPPGAEDIDNKDFPGRGYAISSGEVRINHEIRRVNGVLDFFLDQAVVYVRTTTPITYSGVALGSIMLTDPASTMNYPVGLGSLSVTNPASTTNYPVGLNSLSVTNPASTTNYLVGLGSLFVTDPVLGSITLSRTINIT